MASHAKPLKKGDPLYDKSISVWFCGNVEVAALCLQPGMPVDAYRKVTGEFEMATVAEILTNGHVMVQFLHPLDNESETKSETDDEPSTPLNPPELVHRCDVDDSGGVNVIEFQKGMAEQAQMVWVGWLWLWGA